MPPVDVTRQTPSPNVPFAGASRNTLTPEEIRNIRGGYISRKLGLGETPGERKFNMIDWGGIGYGLNSVVSLAIADSAHNGHLHPALTWTQDRFTEPAFRFFTGSRAKEHEPYLFEKLAEAARAHLKVKGVPGLDAAGIDGMHPRRLFKELEKQTTGFVSTLPEGLGHITAENLAEESAKAMKFLSAGKNAKLFNNFLMLGTGGWLLMFPVKWLEDHKAYLVKRFDNKYERKHHVSAAEKEEIDRRHAEIEAEPRQSWKSVFGARLLTYPLIMATYMGLGREREVNWMSRAGMKGPLAEGSDKWVGDAVKGMRSSLMSDQTAAKGIAVVEAKLETMPAAFSATYETAVRQHKTEVLKAAQEAAAKGLQAPKVRESIHRGFEGSTGEKRLDFITGNILTESFYSAVMAGMTFIASRILGPIVGNRRQPDYVPPSPKRREPAPSVLPEARVAAAYAAPVQQAPSVPLAEPLSPGNVVSAVNYHGASQNFAKDPWDSPDDHRPEPYSASFSAPLASHAERAEQTRGQSGELARV